MKKIKKGMRKQSGKKMHELFFEVLYQGWGGGEKKYLNDFFYNLSESVTSRILYMGFL